VGGNGRKDFKCKVNGSWSKEGEIPPQEEGGKIPFRLYGTRSVLRNVGSTGVPEVSNSLSPKSPRKGWIRGYCRGSESTSEAQTLESPPTLKEDAPGEGCKRRPLQWWKAT